jgi:NAD(P)-dependent dehydrogenase (short-subunit alcohol dehydrogenase family)
MRLKEKVAIITGSTSGIGKATAILFAREGAKVVVTGRRSEVGETTVQEIQMGKGEPIFIKTDVSETQQVKALVKRTINTFRKIDILLNNAGIHPGSARKRRRQEDNKKLDVFLCVQLPNFLFLTYLHARDRFSYKHC